jgi:hydroxyacylglutathione hydrolase
MSTETVHSTGPVARPLPTQWIHGSESSKHNADPDVQVHWYDADSVVLRQNMAINYEAPFLFLLFGSERVVLLDTGATVSQQHFPLRTVVDGLIDSWMSRHSDVDPRYELLILHTHSHGDHTAGDAQFFDRTQTTLVPADITSAWHFLGLSDTSDKTKLGLGGRTLDILATPGHDAAAVTFYDPRTGILFTGDTVYRGRLYINDWQAFSRSIDRLIEFCQSHPVTYVLGCHIEMTSTSGLDYPVRTTYQPDEPPLELRVEHLHKLRSALDAAGPEPVRAICDDFILWPTQ